VGRKGSVGEVVYSRGDFWPIDTTYYVVNKGEHDWRYLFHLLTSLGLTELNSHSAIPGLNRESVYSIPASFPSKDRQRQAALVLDTVEQSRELDETTVQVALALKHAAMTSLFTRGLRGETARETEIGPVPSTWTVGRLGDFAEFQRGFDITKGEQTATGDVPVVSSGGIKSFHDVAAAPGPGVVIGRKGSIGTVHYIASDYWPHDTTLWCTDFRGNLPKFVYYRLQLLDMKRLDSGAANPALNRNFLHAELISWPGVDEQADIVALLDAFDQKIELHQRRCEVLHELFRALLHRIMADEIDVDDLDLRGLAARSTEST
jgi:type I restriction enzyme S subunit